jgi:hypothetical protein
MPPPIRQNTAATFAENDAYVRAGIEPNLQSATKDRQWEDRVDRRHLLGAATSAALFASFSPALAETTRVKLASAFKYLDLYLSLAPADRRHFYMAYRALRDMKPAPDLDAVVVAPEGKRTKLAVTPDGFVVQLPDLAQLRGASMVEFDGSQKVVLAVELRPSIPPSTHVDVAELQLGLDQANAAIKKFSGMLSLVAPKLDSLYFPGAGGGQVILADQRTAPLPVTTTRFFGAVPWLEPSQFSGARSVALARAPSRILLGAHPKAS